MIKLMFKNYPNGDWQDWSEYLVEPPKIRKRVESENAGEAGVISYDKASVTLYNTNNNPVNIAFQKTNLAAINRYIFEIYIPNSSGAQLKRFEGVADFSSLSFPDLSNQVSFDITDRLSALNLITPDISARTLINMDERIQVLPHNKMLFWKLSGNDSTMTYEAGVALSDSSYDEFADIQAPLFNIGDIIISPLDNNKPLEDRKLALVVASYLEYGSVYIYPNDYDNYNFQINLTYNRIKLKAVEPAFMADFAYASAVDVNSIFNSQDVNVLDSNYYGADITRVETISGHNEATSFDAVKIIKQLVSRVWSGVQVTTYLSIFIDLVLTNVNYYPVPIEYYVQLIDEFPFDSHPLDAIKKLADSMQAYIFFNNAGNLVICNKKYLSNNPNIVTIGNTKIHDSTTNYMWDKRVDAVTITMQGYTKDQDGNFLEATETVSKLNHIKPRNELKKSILSINPNARSLDQLKANAAYEAQLYFEFYGNKHEAIPITVHLDDNSLSWDVIDTILIDSHAYFFTTMDYDLVQRTIDIEAIRTAPDEYNETQALISMGKNEYLFGTKEVNSKTYLPILRFEKPIEISGALVKCLGNSYSGGRALAVRKLYNNKIDLEWDNQYKSGKSTATYYDKSASLNITAADLRIWNSIYRYVAYIGLYSLTEKVYRRSDGLLSTASGIVETEYPNDLNNGFYKWYKVNEVFDKHINDNSLKYMITISNIPLNKIFAVYVAAYSENVKDIPVYGEMIL